MTQGLGAHGNLEVTLEDIGLFVSTSLVFQLRGTLNPTPSIVYKFYP
jgi:hypothetical protein